MVSPSVLWPNSLVSWKTLAAQSAGILILLLLPSTFVCLSLLELLFGANCCCICCFFWRSSLLHDELLVGVLVLVVVVVVMLTRCFSSGFLLSFMFACVDVGVSVCIER